MLPEPLSGYTDSVIYIIRLWYNNSGNVYGTQDAEKYK